MHEGIHEQDISRYPVSPIQRESVDRKNAIRDQEEDERMVQEERRNYTRDPEIVATPLITPSRDIPVITESVSDPERKILFDNDEKETHDNRAERSQMVDRPFRG